MEGRARSFNRAHLRLGCIDVIFMRLHGRQNGVLSPCPSIEAIFSSRLLSSFNYAVLVYRPILP